jgi:hypothetical protein
VEYRTERSEGGYAAKARHGSRGANYDSAARQTDKVGGAPRSGSSTECVRAPFRARTQIYAVAVEVDEELEFSPTCAACLVQLVPVEFGRHVAWECPGCRLVRIG